MMLNCSVALAASQDFLTQRAPRKGSQDNLLHEEDIQQAADGFTWPGRFQLVVEGPHNWYFDTAHNEMSVSKASEWFIGAISGEIGATSREDLKRVLIFGQLSNLEDAVSVLASLAVCLKPVHLDRVIFTPCQSSYDRSQIENGCTKGMYIACPVKYSA